MNPSSLSGQKPKDAVGLGRFCQRGENLFDAMTMRIGIAVRYRVDDDQGGDGIE